MKALREALKEYLKVRRTCGFKLPQLAVCSISSSALWKRGDFLYHQGTRRAMGHPAQELPAVPMGKAARHGAVFCPVRQCSGPEDRDTAGRSPSSPLTSQEPLSVHGRRDRASDRGGGPAPSPLGLRAATYATFFGLLAVTGMRMSEPLALDRDDVDLTRGILTVRHTKFGKSRLIPIHASTLKELRRYAELGTGSVRGHRPPASLLPNGAPV